MGGLGVKRTTPSCQEDHVSPLNPPGAGLVGGRPRQSVRGRLDGLEGGESPNALAR